MVDSVSEHFDRGAAAFLAVADRIWDPIGADAVAGAQWTRDSSVFDGCCGVGSSALPVARAVGPTGHVDAVDLAAGLVERGRERAAAAGLDNVDFRVEDVVRWPERGHRYDALVCVLGVFFLPRPAADTAAMLRGVRPGGTALLTVWAAGAVQPLGRQLWQACADVAPERFSTPPSRSPAALLETPAGLRRFGAAVGLSQMDVRATPRTSGCPPRPSGSW